MRVWPTAARRGVAAIAAAIMIVFSTYIIINLLGLEAPPIFVLWEWDWPNVDWWYLIPMLQLIGLFYLKDELEWSVPIDGVRSYIGNKTNQRIIILVFVELILWSAIRSIVIWSIAPQMYLDGDLSTEPRLRALNLVDSLSGATIVLLTVLAATGHPKRWFGNTK